MDQLGDYLVRRLIGEGGMGKVYEAEERLSRRRVAVKVLHPELSRSEQGRRLFLNEMQILAHLEHPNIVRSLASTEVGGELVMVLEYLDGRTLRSVIHERGRLPWGDAVHVVTSIASALVAAHGQAPPIIHRDLKPENIMVLADGSVKVMDFGIAKVIEALHQTNTQSVGTLQYMSPEQIDARTIDHRSDLYCLGLILYEMLVGTAPFQAASPRQLLNQQCTADPPPLPEEVRAGMPKAIEQLLFQLLEKAPADRPDLAEDVVERLEPFEVAGGGSLRLAGAAGRPANAVTPHRRTPRAATPSAPDDRVSFQAGYAAALAESAARSGAPAASAPVASAGVERVGAEAGPAVGAMGRAPAPVHRADTIALVEQVDKQREVPTRVAVGIIVAVSLLGGLAAYLVRATGEPEPPPAPSANVVRPVDTRAPIRGEAVERETS
ncbi:MAG: serine/threonine-protein kinase [Polyangiaceae bacterium]